MNRTMREKYKESKLLDKIVIRIYDTFEGYSLFEILSIAIPSAFLGLLLLLAVIVMLIEYPVLIMIPLSLVGIVYLIKLADKRAKSLFGNGFLKQY